MAHTKQTACKSNPTPGLATYQGGTVSSSSEEQEMESTISETHGERERAVSRQSSHGPLERGKGVIEQLLRACHQQITHVNPEK